MKPYFLDEDDYKWSANEGKGSASFQKTGTSVSIDSHASLDTIDSGVPTRLVDDSTVKFFNA